MREPSKDALLVVDSLTVQYRLEKTLITAVDSVSLDVGKSEALGIVGESGCGKSTFASAVIRILPSNSSVMCKGIFFEGNDLLKMSEDQIRKEIRWKRISMIFQSSMNALNPVYRVGSTLADAAIFKRGCTRDEAENEVARLFELVGLNPAWMSNYPHQYSGGMKQRAVIAMSLICNPSLIIADEPTTALDVVVQGQILKRLKQLQRELGISLVIISHDIAVVGEMCERVAVMYGGQIFETGSTDRLFSRPNNPYTRALLECFPDIRNPKKTLKGIPGDPPDLAMISGGCRFAQRCSLAKKICRTDPPPLIELERGHVSLCHFAKELS